jgi:hypothetical protein
MSDIRSIKPDPFMKLLLKKFFYAICLVLLLHSCTKEMSLETGAASGIASGILTDSLGQCKKATINGTYYINSDLVDTNFVIVNVNFTALGKYLIYSDTVNGMWFIDSGYVLSTGDKTIKLKGKGRPLTAGTTDFKTYFGNSSCGFSLLVGGPNNGSSTSSYCPTTADGWIRYQLTPGFDFGGGLVLDTFRSTISPFPFTYLGKNYFKYQTTPTMDTLSVTGRYTNGEYWSLGTPEYDYLYLYDTVANNAEYIYLKDNVIPGTTNATWFTAVVRAGTIQSGVLFLGNARLKITVTDINQTGIYLGTTFTDIIKVKREMLFTPDGSSGIEQTLLAADVFYAKGIGMVEQKLYSPNTPANIIQRIVINGYKGL